jgi:hypothetical protein
MHVRSLFNQVHRHITGCRCGRVLHSSISHLVHASCLLARAISRHMSSSHVPGAHRRITQLCTMQTTLAISMSHHQHRRLSISAVMYVAYPHPLLADPDHPLLAIIPHLASSLVCCFLSHRIAWASLLVSALHATCTSVVCRRSGPTRSTTRSTSARSSSRTPSEVPPTPRESSSRKCMSVLSYSRLLFL